LGAGGRRFESARPDFAGLVLVICLAAAGDGAIAGVLVASIVVPLAVLGVVLWFFWKHRHDD
jgi:uncharacterized paraquat-inducible protein A